MPSHCHSAEVLDTQNLFILAFNLFLASYHQHWLPEAELDRVMETYDKNGNGTIEFDEFQSIVSQPRMHAIGLLKHTPSFEPRPWVLYKLTDE